MEETFSEVDSQQTDGDYASEHSLQSLLEDDHDSESLVSYYSDTDSTDSNLLNYFLDFDDIIGKDMVIFSYMKPKALYLHKPSPADTLKSLAIYVKQNMNYHHNFHRMAILFPDELYLQDIGDVVTLKPGTALLVLPKMLCKLTIVIHKLNTLFEVDIDLCSHVLAIKHRIEAEHGFPIQHQDLLHKEQCLENHDRLYQYEIRSQSVLDLHLHYHYNMVVRVKTFWKTVYDLFLDPCMLVSEVLEIILKRCVSPRVYEDACISVLDDFMIPKQVLILTMKGRTLHPESTLGFYHIKDGDTMNLTTIGRQYRVSVYPIEVSLNDGRAARIVVSEFDTWAIVALHMHGITAVTLDKLRLFHNNNLVNYSKPIGNSGATGTGYTEIRHPVQRRRHTKKASSRDTPLTEVSVMVHLGSSVTETIKCPRNFTMSDIKERLEEMGIPNATQYHLTSKYSTFPDTAILKNIIKNDHSSLKVTLKLEQLPLTVQLPNNNLINVTVQVNQTLETVFDAIQKKSKLSLKHHKLLLGGNEFSEAPTTLAYDSGLGIGTNLYMVSKKSALSFQIHSDVTETKLKLVANLNPQQMKHALWKEKNLPPSCLSSLETFLKWHLSLVSVKATGVTPQTIVLPSISQDPNIYPGNLVQDTFASHLSYREFPGQPELSPMTGTFQLHRKKVQFADDHMPSRPRAARSHRKLASIERPVFDETSVDFDRKRLDILSSSPNWTAKKTESDLPRIIDSSLKTQANSSITGAPGESESFGSCETDNKIEPWSYIS